MTTLNDVRQVIAPASLPVTVAEAKAYMKLDAGDTTYDALIERLIGAARDYGQGIQRRSWEARTLRATYLETTEVIDLPYSPIVTIISVLRPPATAITGANLLGNRLYLPAPEPDGLVVDYIAGTGSTHAEQLAVLKAVSTAFENREDIAESGYTNLHQALDHLKINRNLIF